ncbi:MAG TPA: SpoIIE family protein phosphatase [Capsulimonadaceae bacterium]|nr:SpoIIE family protein phosphatase [Capsulimonadaceae bacterium]
MTSEVYLKQLQDMSQRIAHLYERIEQPAPERSLVSDALQELSITIEELRVADEEIRTQAEELASANDAIEDQRYRYEEMFEFAPDGYIITDPEGRIEEANQVAAHLLNIGRRLLVGKPLISFVPPEDRQNFWRGLHRLDEQSHVQEIEMRIRPRRSETFDVAATVGVVRDRQGRTTACRWLLRDASARRLSEEERYRQIVSEITDYAILRIDQEGRIRAWNRGAERIFGYKESEVAGRGAGLIFTVEDRAKGAPQREMDDAAREGRSANYRWHLPKDGVRFWAENVMTALHDNSGNVTGFVKIVRDQTEQKRASEALSAAYEQQHRIADALQGSMLHKMPKNHYPGLEIEIFYQSALNEAYVGGDFFDTFALGDGRVALVAGDVSGKGLAAASRTTEIRYALRAFLDEHRSASKALFHLNNFISRTALGLSDDEASAITFVAITLVLIDPTTGDAEFTAAGAEAPVILHPHGAWEGTDAGGILIGVDRDASYFPVQKRLEHGDTILFATDGLTEARSGEAFLDQSGLVKMALEIERCPHPPISLEEFGKALMERVVSYAGGSLRDDACLLLARRVPPA